MVTISLHWFSGRQSVTSSWGKGHINTNAILIPCKPKRLSCFRLALIWFVLFMSVCGIRSPFSLSCNTEVNKEDLGGWIVISPTAVLYLLLLLLIPLLGSPSQRPWKSWEHGLWILIFDYHSDASLRLFNCQDAGGAVGWTMHLAFASRWSPIVPSSGAEIFPLPSPRWSNAITRCYPYFSLVPVESKTFWETWLKSELQDGWGGTPCIVPTWRKTEAQSCLGLHSYIPSLLKLQLQKENQLWRLTRVWSLWCMWAAHRCTSLGRGWLGKLPKEGLAAFKEGTAMHAWGLLLQWAWCSCAQGQHGRDEGTSIWTCKTLQMRQRSITVSQCKCPLHWDVQNL